MSGLDNDLQRLRLRLRSGSLPTDSALLADLEAAYAELRTAEDEVRSQRAEIAALLRGHQVLRLHQERTLAMMPVAVLVTDGTGLIRWANAPAAELLGMRTGRLVGRSALTLVSPADRPQLRTAIGAVPDEQPPVRHRVTLLHRGLEPFEAEVTLTCSTDESDRITWMLLAAQTLQSTSDVARLPETLARLSRLAGTAADAAEAFGQAATLVAEALDGMDVSMSAGSPLAPQVAVTTSTTAQRIDGAQVRAGEGPSATAFETAIPVETDEVRTDDRWPRLAPLAPPGLAAVAVPLAATGTPLGTLSVYGPGERLLGERSQACELFATTVAAAVYELHAKEKLTTLATDLERAMASRSVIEQAKGIIMATERCDAEAAFAHLAELSSTQHVKLRDLAAQIVEGVAAP